MSKKTTAAHKPAHAHEKPVEAETVAHVENQEETKLTEAVNEPVDTAKAEDEGKVVADSKAAQDAVEQAEAAKIGVNLKPTEYTNVKFKGNVFHDGTHYVAGDLGTIPTKDVARLVEIGAAEVVA